MAMPIQIGDVIALANMCYGIAQAFGSGRKAAPVEFREVQNELYGLGQMLELLKNSVESGAIVTTTYTQFGQPSPTHQASQSIARMVANCQTTVGHLKEFARKYAPLAGVQFIEDDTGVRVRKLSSTSRQKLLLNWKRIKWVAESSNIQGIRDQISIHVQSITAVVSLVNTHAINAVQIDVQNLARYAEGHRLDLEGARAKLYDVHMDVSVANSNIHHVSSGLHMVQQDIQSLNHKLETIMRWQQRDMPSEALQGQLSALLVKIEQLERGPSLPPQVQPCPPSASTPSLLPYPLEDGMPRPYGNPTPVHSVGFYQSSNSSLPSFTDRHSNLAYGIAPTRSVTQFASITVAELPAGPPTRNGGAASLSVELPSEPVQRISPLNTEPIEIGVQRPREEDLPPRGSRKRTATDIVFELCLETRVKDVVAEFKTLCMNARFHGNWTKATVETSEYNEGLFACLCEPFEHEDEDFEPHAQILESYFLTNATVGCHYHGKVQWILHNVGDFNRKKPATLGIRNLSIQNEMKFERAFIEPIALKTAKAIVKGEPGNYFAYELRDEKDGNQIAILNSMADDSFSGYLESITFVIENEINGNTEKITKRNIKHTNLLHYKTIGVKDVEQSGTWKRDALKYTEYVEMLVHFSPSNERDQVDLLKFHLNEVNLESNYSQDDCVVTLTMTRGEATFPRREPQREKVTGVAEFKFSNSKAANEFLLRQKDMSDELHWLKIQHSKRNENVMVKLFAEQIEAAAKDVHMSNVELVVVWDEKRNRGRILARSRDGSCYLSQTLHSDFFKRFAELSSGELFNGSAEFYQPTNKPEEKVKKYPGGVGSIQFRDSTTANTFYTRLTESARRFGFVTEPKIMPEVTSTQITNTNDKPTLQRSITQKTGSRNRNFSEEHYKKILTETAAIEDALPKQNLTRPLDAEELLDLLNRTEEKLLYNLEDPGFFPIIEAPKQPDTNEADETDAEIMAPSEPSERSLDDIYTRRKDRMKAENSPRPDGSFSEMIQPDYSQESEASHKVPQTAKTLPGLLPSDRESKSQLRRPASFDDLRPERERKEQKVLIPLDGTGVGFLFPEPKHQRSHSANGLDTLPSVPSPIARTSGLNVAPVEIITGRPIIQSPEGYNPDDREVIERIEDQRKYIDGTVPKQRSIHSLSITVEDTDGAEYERGASPIQPIEESSTSSYRPAFDRGSSLPIIATRTGIRAYRLTTNVDGKLTTGTLVWANESDPAAKRFDEGLASVQVQHFEGGPLTWVPKSILKQARYYAMNDKQRVDEDGGRVKLMRNDILVPLQDEAESRPIEPRLRVVRLTEKFSVSVERDWMREVNLSFQMS
ncbi:hypothetical protein H072_2014 [Dactylellina haptotyla CBS 200.50]|uniref:Fungal N-terminal domain-containing protein n=1 Tax=Dactylellina haptotyla (strain CBS 200.50) TaxID=1284197 RepID=S8C8L3_DACHA|nr:hypothetical protein H072_2014 [Dactylellina haptotyla CBS 200.50]